MAAGTHDEDLNILKVIAETLNRSNDLNYMLQTVLDKLLDLTSLETGWMFLVDEKPDFTLIADRHLPPALSWGDKTPMCRGGCSCLSRFWKEELQDPINIIECKRIEDAIKYKHGDTKGITHHATIPLAAGEERFGILNVASTGKDHFSEEELTLLQSVAFQIGTAIKRTRLFQAQQKRAENFEHLNEVIRMIWKTTDGRTLTEKVANVSREIFNWPLVAFFTKEGEGLCLHSIASDEAGIEASIRLALDDRNEISESYNNQEVMIRKLSKVFPMVTSNITVPISVNDEKIGVMFIGYLQEYTVDKDDSEIVKALAAHVSLAYESIRLQEKRRELVLYEERNRLARDLHDSVNQKLFSLSLTARGVKEVIGKENQSMSELMDEMLGLSQDSLREMRSLIWQLRPVGIEEGLASAMKTYAKSLGMKVWFQLDILPAWSQSIEEALWRISQEAFNNIKKHAAAESIHVHLFEKSGRAHMKISDQGKGFDVQEGKKKRSLGLTSMRERATLLGGSLEIYSTEGKGTTIYVSIPKEMGGKH